MLLRAAGELGDAQVEIYDYRDVPLYCFLRMRSEPVFRVLRFERERMATSIVVEYGANKKKLATREEFRFRRDRHARLVVEERLRV